MGGIHNAIGAIAMHALKLDVCNTCAVRLMCIEQRLDQPRSESQAIIISVAPLYRVRYLEAFFFFGGGDVDDETVYIYNVNDANVITVFNDSI